MDLKDIILKECLDAEAKENGFVDWETASEAYNESKPGFGFVRKFTAYSKALDRLDSVMRWANLNGWVVFTDKEEKQWRRHTPRIKDFGEKEFLTDAELLQLYKEKNG